MKLLFQSFIFLIILSPAAAQLPSQQEFEEMGRSRAPISLFYQYPIGKQFWIEPRLTDTITTRIPFYKSIDTEKADSWEFFIDPVFPQNLVSFTPMDYFEAKTANRIGRKNFAYSVRMEDGELLYIDGERFGREYGSSYLARDEAVRSKWILGVTQIESEKIYTQNPVILREMEERKKIQKVLDAKRRGGVQIGMTKKQVLASNWGAPESINTTTTGRNVFEQWVYGGKNYLYFENGILKTIQN